MIQERIQQPLDPREVRQARKLDIEYSKQMEVNEKVCTQQALERGHQVLGGRWVDVKKAGGARRSRLVTKEIRPDNAPELFPATPQNESNKYLMRSVALGKSWNTMHVEITRAYVVDATC